LPFLKLLLSACADRELVDHVCDGAQFKADLPLHAVFLPRLDSLVAYMELVEAEVVRLAGLGWVELQRPILFFPVRLQPNGTTVRRPASTSRTARAATPTSARPRGPSTTPAAWQ
jgi:hypothetical protein